ncbi:unnamed protein product [Caenorhabditis bovis]|uniref:K Homology domain-containing protein n=1 Tax=Caenorhabditis bovis TaxID=2654633 RepID=A0A8S1EXI0_9PELO|nr:unnamed protein product [Caenorhabditis bovis]
MTSSRNGGSRDLADRHLHFPTIDTMEAAMSHANLIAYMNELIGEMRQLVDSPMEFRNAQICLSNEITRVWSMFQKTAIGQSETIKKNLAIPNTARHDSNSMCTPASYTDSSSLINSFKTPIKYRGRAGDDQHDDDASQSLVVLQTKVYIPEPPRALNGRPVKCNYIGRILGPSGQTAKMIERQYEVTLLIRGRGSVRDAKREHELIGKKGFEHLAEPLHVLLMAKHKSRQACEEILDRAAQKVESLLTPVHDELKKDQLLRLALINGTYVQRTPQPSPENEQRQQQQEQHAQFNDSMYYL